jgi:large repetitive protein
MPLTSGDCDDGNNANNDGCSNTCEIEDGWYCYGGTSLVEDTCYEECGDGYDFGNFGCDDGNDDPNDGCSATCSVEPGWTCTGGNATTADTCLDTCGDGLLEDDGVTECDDGNDTNQYDGCHDCVVLDGWYCYGGSASAASGCYEFAGDGLDFGSFDCDNIDNGTFDGCSSGEIEDGYYCYGGTRTTGDRCYEICGDNINPSQIDGNADDCDDNNNADGDGCNTNCEIEEGYYCYGGSSSTPDGCYEICGDGLVEGNFDCDDGNSDNGDGYISLVF